MSGGRNDCRIYVGNLPPDIRTKDIQDLFYKFGKVTFVDLKNRRGPPFAFVEFEDPRQVLCMSCFGFLKFVISRDADDAVHARDGYDYDGYRLRVEFPRGGGGGGGGGGGFRGGRGGGERGRGSRGPPARRSQFRVLVTGKTIEQHFLKLASFNKILQKFCMVLIFGYRCKVTQSRSCLLS